MSYHCAHLASGWSTDVSTPGSSVDWPVDEDSSGGGGSGSSGGWGMSSGAPPSGSMDQSHNGWGTTAYPGNKVHNNCILGDLNLFNAHLPKLIIR